MKHKALLTHLVSAIEEDRLVAMLSKHMHAVWSPHNNCEATGFALVVLVNFNDIDPLFKQLSTKLQLQTHAN